MLYPPKKRAYSPENKKTKELSNLMNINSKFTGSGGSNSTFTQTHLPSHPKKPLLFQKNQSQASSKPIANLMERALFSESIMTEEISLLPSVSMEPLEK